MDRLAEVRQRFTVLEAVLDEKSRRLLVAAESKAWGAGGISAISKTTGVSRQAIRQGLRELKQSPTHPAGRIRRPGGGRKSAKQKDPTLMADLESWSNLSREAIRNPGCAGPARACGSWPKSYRAWGMK